MRAQAPVRKNWRQQNDENMPPSASSFSCSSSSSLSSSSSKCCSPMRVPLAKCRLNEVQEGQDRRLRCKLDWDRLLLETDTGVKIVLRVRPLISKEQEEAAARSLFVVSSNSVTLEHQQFTCDGVAGENSTQQHVFDMVGSPMVAHCLDGFNCSMFAFGQTGSGKTYTMWGSIPKSGSLSDEAGLAPRFFKALFLRIEQPAIKIDVLPQKQRTSSRQEVQYQCRFTTNKSGI